MVVVVFACLLALLALDVSIEAKCNLKVIDYPNIYYAFLEDTAYSLKCTFKADCRPNLFYDFNPLADDNTFRPVHSDFYLIEEGYTFPTKISVSGNHYSIELVLDPFAPRYAGKFRCGIREARNPSNQLYQEFRLYVVELGPIPSYPPCFLPLVRDITVSSFAVPEGERVALHWQLTKKEDPTILYCYYSRDWKVRVLSFPNVAAAPADYEIVKSSVEWVNVMNQDTNYSFVNALSPKYYYSFQVEHQGGFTDAQKDEFGIKPVTFASQIYYFGYQHPAMITKPPYSVIKLHVGSSRSVHCVVSGSPLPSVKWIRESGSPPTVRRNNSAILELNHVTQEHAGTYYCVAFNTQVNPPKGRRDESDTWTINVIIEEDVLVAGLSCRSLTTESGICRNYIYTGLKIFTNHSTNESSLEREKRAEKLALDINQYIPLGTCRNLAYSMMCHNVYPYCDVAPGKPTPRKLCKRVCQEFVSGQCKGYISKSSPLYEMLVEGCDSRDFTGGDSPECIPLSYQAYRYDQVESIEDTGNCIRGDGRGYSGNRYRTNSGALCQSWTAQTPHPHPMLPDLYRSDLDQAHFSCRNPGGVGERPWCYTDDPSIRWEYCSIPECDTCEMYIGETCRSLEDYASINVTIRRNRRLQSQDDIEEKISLFSRSILYLQPSEGCKDILRVLLCHGAFPHCTGTSTKQLCFVYCQFNQALKDLCPSVFEEFSEFVASNQHFMNAPDCTLEGGDQCMTVSQLGPSIQQVANSDCYEGNGVTYNGTVSKTKSGSRCQSWDSQEPHSHPITPARYPELLNSKNYCRNPGSLMQRPWCYTNDSERVWGYCEVEHCGDIGYQPPGLIDAPSSSPSIGFKNTYSGAGRPELTVIATVGGVIAGLLICLFCVAFIGCYFVLCRKNRQGGQTKLEILSNIPFDEGKKYVLNKNYDKINMTMPSHQPQQSQAIPENFTVLDSKDVKYVSQLGQGNFGIVFKGKAFGIKQFEEDEEDEGIYVAVKMLKEEATSEVKQDFIDEAKLMFTFDHPNILKIHGVCMTEMPYQLVFEYMDEGDLTKFLRSRASSQQRRLTNPLRYRSRTESSYSNDPASLTKTELVYICKQIAAGMKYLADNKHIHRDLACRNCLIKSDLVVKIGDFGMSRNLYSKDYYRIKGNAVLPVRWMSPESLIYGKFSVESDVWSFGVVMWEVFSFALQPYYGITNEQVIEAVRKGKTLYRPDDCPVEIYHLMKECWAMEPVERISFSELYNSLFAHHHLYSVSSDTYNKNEDAEGGDSEGSSNAFYSNESLDM